MNNKIIFHFFVFTEQRYSIQKNNLRSLGCTFWMEKTPLFCYLSSKMMFFLNVSAFYFIKKKKLEVQPRTTLSFATLTAVNELPFFFFWLWWSINEVWFDCINRSSSCVWLFDSYPLGNVGLIWLYCLYINLLKTTFRICEASTMNGLQLLFFGNSTPVTD